MNTQDEKPGDGAELPTRLTGTDAEPKPDECRRTAFVLDTGGLNLISTGSCVRWNCRHTQHGKRYFHPQCHPEAGVLLNYPTPDVVQTVCALCATPRCEMAVSENKPWRCKRHPAVPVWLSYQHKSSELKVECGECHRKVTTIATRRVAGIC